MKDWVNYVAGSGLNRQVSEPGLRDEHVNKKKMFVLYKCKILDTELKLSDYQLNRMRIKSVIVSDRQQPYHHFDM